MAAAPKGGACDQAYATIMRHPITLFRRVSIFLLMLLAALSLLHPADARGVSPAHLFSYSSTGSVCGVVFCDNRGDGKCDNGDTLLCGVTVTIKNSSGSTCGSATTDGNGKYTCSGLKPGNYTACVPSNCGGRSACSYDCAACVSSGQCTTKNFCYQGPGSICGVVSTSCGDNNPCSNNGNPVCGVPVTIKNSSGATCGTDTTDSKGKYSFGSLAPGSYTVQVPATYNGLPVCSYNGKVTVSSCQCTTDNFCYQGPGSVCGLIFNDCCGSGCYNFWDVLLCGVPVALVDNSGHTVATTTSFFGLYCFNNVAPGSYTVKTPATYCGLVLCPGSYGVTVAACQTACVCLCYQCPPPVGSISITASVPHGCIPVTGGSIDYSYTVTNTGSAALTGVTVTDSLWGTTANIGNLAVGNSVNVTFSKTRTAAQISADAVSGVITTSITAAGANSATGSKVTASTPASISVTVIHPSLGLTITPNPGTASPGDTVMFTYTVTNTGDIAIDNITVTDGQGNTLGTITQLAMNDSQSFSENVTIPANATNSYSVSGTAAGVDDCGGSPAQAQTTGTVVVVPHAQIVGTVTCSECGCGVVGASVQLLDSSNAVVAQTTTGTGGAYTFTGVPDGSYTVSVTDAPDYSPNTGMVTNYTHTGSDYTVPVIALNPRPIVYRSVQTLSGRAFFGTDPAFAVLLVKDSGGNPVTLQLSDLYTSTNVSSSTIKTYLYNGTIPDFPEMGHFGGPGEPQIYVYYTQPLLPDTVWNNSSFTNQIGVYGVQGTPAEGTTGYYIYRFQFSMPFDGPGTAYNYTYTGVESSYPTRVPTLITPLSPSWIGGGAIPAAPPTGDLPVGWMARGIGEFQVPAYQTSTLYVDGSYTDVCGDLFTFHIHPDMGGGIGSD
jgi:uncharacterized repeat protein (TIGR01451 family)